MQTLNIFISRAQNQESKPQQLMWSPAHLQDHQLLLVFQQTRTATMPYLLGQLLLHVVWAGISCLNQRNLLKSLTEASLWLKRPETLLLVLFVNRIVHECLQVYPFHLRWEFNASAPVSIQLALLCYNYTKQYHSTVWNKFRFFCNELHLVFVSFMWRVASFFYVKDFRHKHRSDSESQCSSTCDDAEN